MKRKATPVWRLAEEAGVDIDLVLVTLWDLGATNIDARKDVVPSRFVDPARRELGVATRRDVQRIKYWAEVLGESEIALRARLEKEGYRVARGRAKLPSGALKFLKAATRSKGIDPLTGVIRRPKSTSKSSVPSKPQPAPSFSLLGRQRDLRFLDPEEIVAIHIALVAAFARRGDPIDPPGVRNRHLLESALFRPKTSLNGVWKYPSAETSAAALLYSLIHNHPFHNGNKRTALVATVVFLDENDMSLTCTEDDLFKFVLLVAQHRIAKGKGQDGPDHETYAVAQQLCRWSRTVNRDERVMAFRKFRPILAGYGCDIDIAGNKANIVREARKSYLGFTRKRKLHTQIHYDGEGRDMNPATIKKMRRDLRLDAVYGVDSVDFYSKKPLRTDEIIVEYKNILRRLASL